MATQKRNRNSEQAGRTRRYRRPDAAAESDSDWLSDPVVANLVKTQVEDTELVNIRRNQFVKQAAILFAGKGYHSTSIKEVADAAGVSPGLIYQYVSDKEEVLFLALQLIVHTNKKVLPARIAAHTRPVHKFAAGFEAYCRVVDANREACILTYRETKSLSRPHRDAIKNMELSTNQILADVVRDCIAAGDFHDLNVELYVYNAIVIAHAWALKHWRLRKITTLSEYRRHNTDLLMAAALTERGRKEYNDYLAATQLEQRPKRSSTQAARAAR